MVVNFIYLVKKKKTLHQIGLYACLRAFSSEPEVGGPSPLWVESSVGRWTWSLPWVPALASLAGGP